MGYHKQTTRAVRCARPLNRIRSNAPPLLFTLQLQSIESSRFPATRLCTSLQSLSLLLLLRGKLFGVFLVEGFGQFDGQYLTKLVSYAL